MTGATNTLEETRLLTRDEIHTHPYLRTLNHPSFEDTRWVMLASYRKMLFVRHPLQRVVSTFKDKLEGYTGRERLEFPKYIKQKIEERFGTRLGELVSFEDFVRFVADQGEDEPVEMDPHWRSLHQMCNPCTIEYGFIGKFENLREDSSYAIQWMGAGMDNLPRALYFTSSSLYAPGYLALLNTHLRQAFLHKYLLDYISFDYPFFV
ncbi:carbohydrate sulfotransferase 9-like [Homarus americanus]|uniref:Carbohydrate sulfotransferase n=1 Tax=Homarus americanus TaxID=6706 RepID=A0A8J5NB51_HOMAM|nr:carbohydrate sulfotransferase 9-like [Homarus americanus]KAG7176269.1 Carbohydrate sulfotransferase 9-like 1 [Homarus americanus]